MCIATFLFARADRRARLPSFFRALLGPGWVVFEAAYVLFVVLILAVFGAAAGAIAAAPVGLPAIVGTLALMAGIVAFVAFGNASVERLFNYVSSLLYGVYALFLLLALTRFGDRHRRRLREAMPPRRAGRRRAHLCELQHRRRGGDPARCRAT